MYLYTPESKAGAKIVSNITKPLVAYPNDWVNRVNLILDLE